MAIAFVVPCLNEELLIEAGACSLGFGACDTPAAEDTFLILVDNGSTDDTLPTLRRIADASRPGSVRIVIEPEKGFVPARHRGASVVAELAEEIGVAPKEVLILQADADTIYLPGYARAMWQALDRREGFLLEGAMKRPADFDSAHPEYRDLERSVDSSLEEAGVPDDDEVIVADAVCGYLLADYLRWGGHFRERHPKGGTVHAETTRLFLRAKLAYGAGKIRVNPAQAVTSRRRILEDPALHFATSGFPREEPWLSRWRRRHQTRWTVDEFARSIRHPDVVEACFYRKAHGIALFALLPWVVGRATNPVAFDPADERATRLLELVPRFSVEELIDRPADALISVLDTIDQRPDVYA